MNRTRIGTALAVAVVLGSAGCANNDNSQQGISMLRDEDADQMNARNSRFDNAEDPPMNGQTRFAAGQLAEAQKAPPAMAIEQYKLALAADPKHQGALYRLGVLQASTKQYTAAIETWKQYVQVTEGSAGAWGNLGFCQELAGHPVEAEAAYKQGVAKEPANKLCRVNYGLMLARMNRTGDAYAQLRTVLSTAAVHYNLASVHEMQGRKEEAKVNYAKALELDPNLTEARQRMAAIKE